MQTLYTIGHSTRSIEDFVGLLTAYDIQELVDVRTIAGSRRHPQFSSEALAAALEQAGITYRHLKQLGGLRRPSKDSLNTGWHNLSFRGYADYMATNAFQQGLQALTTIAEKQPTAIMCAEAVPWRCHRSLIADALTVQGWHVMHILNKSTAQPHKPTPFLIVHNGKLIYPAEEGE
jgi:uncharacterized protein (DUF488 family)